MIILNIFLHKTSLCEKLLMLSSLYLVMVVGKAIISYPDGEVRRQQAVPQSQITAENLENSISF